MVTFPYPHRKLVTLWVQRRNKLRTWPRAETRDASATGSDRDSSIAIRTLQQWVPLHILHCRSCADGNARCPPHQKCSHTHGRSHPSTRLQQSSYYGQHTSEITGFCLQKEWLQKEIFSHYCQLFSLISFNFSFITTINQEKKCPEAVSAISFFH